MHVTYNPPYPVILIYLEIRREYCQQNSLEMLTSKALCAFHL